MAEFKDADLDDRRKTLRFRYVNKNALAAAVMVYNKSNLDNLGMKFSAAAKRLKNYRL